MRYVLWLALTALPVSFQPYRFPSKGSAEQRALYERGQVHQIRFEQKFFLDTGFKSLESIASEKRTVKRALFQAPYMMLSLPGVEIERKADGVITLTMIGRTGETTPAVLSSSAWTRLTSLQGTLLDRKPYVPWNPPKANKPLPPPPPLPVCHGWIVRFGVVNETGIGSGSWASCGGTNNPGVAYAVEMARLAVSTRPTCRFEENNPFWSFQKCFSPSPQP